MDRAVGFAGFPRVEAAPAGGVAVLGAPHGTPYRPGTPSHAAGGAAALRGAIRNYDANVTHYDFDLMGTLVEDGGPAIVDLGDVAVEAADDGAANRAAIRAVAAGVLDAGSVPVLFGGDDSVPIPLLQAYEGRGRFTVLQVDAHIDWRDEVGGVRHGFSSTMRRASEMPWIERIVQVGARGTGSARAGDYEDALAWGAKIFTAHDVYRDGIAPVLECIPAGAQVLVALDIDGLDPTVVPGVLAPAPGGLVYRDVIALLDGIADRGRIAGFDLVELVPENDPAGLGVQAAARLALNAIGRILRRL